MVQVAGRVARFDSLSVRKESGTRQLAAELARLMTRRHGHRISQPDAVHEAIKAEVNRLKTLDKMDSRGPRVQDGGGA